MCNITLPHDPYGPALAFIAKLLRKSPYEGRTRWREQSRKKPSRPARIAYGCHTGIFSIARARRELKQLCCYINPDFSVKKSDVNEHYEFDYPKIRKKNRTGKYLARGHGVRTERSEVRAPWTQSISTYSFFPRTKRLWNKLHVEIVESILLSKELLGILYFYNFYATVWFRIIFLYMSRFLVKFIQALYIFLLVVSFNRWCDVCNGFYRLNNCRCREVIGCMKWICKDGL